MNETIWGFIKWGVVIGVIIVGFVALSVVFTSDMNSIETVCTRNGMEYSEQLFGRGMCIKTNGSRIIEKCFILREGNDFYLDCKVIA